MISHSLRSIPVEGECRLSTINLHIHGEIALGAAYKVLAASFFIELPLWLIDSTLDAPEASDNKAFLPWRLERLPAFLADTVDLLP
jgi:hypothetical protein